MFVDNIINQNGFGIQNLQCTISVISDSLIANTGDIIRLTANVSPGAQVIFSITHIKSGSITNFTCDGTSGSCSIDWDTKTYLSGTYNITADVPGQCFSQPIQIALSTKPLTLGDILFISIVALPAVLYGAYLILSKK